MMRTQARDTLATSFVIIACEKWGLCRIGTHSSLFVLLLATMTMHEKYCEYAYTIIREMVNHVKTANHMHSAAVASLPS